MQDALEVCVSRVLIIEPEMCCWFIEGADVAIFTDIFTSHFR